jgi:hypothetical protein
MDQRVKAEKALAARQQKIGDLESKILREQRREDQQAARKRRQSTLSLETGASATASAIDGPGGTPSGSQALESDDVSAPISHPVRVFISYSHDSDGHMEQVRAVSDRLRRHGVDCRIDQYEMAPAEGWPQWMLNQIEDADFVLVVCTEVYHRRVRGREEAGRGLGAAWEGVIITQELYDAHGTSSKFIPVVFSAKDAAHRPVFLRGQTFHRLDTETGYDALYRQLTDQPEVPMPPLGELRHMPPRSSFNPIVERNREQDPTADATPPRLELPWFDIHRSSWGSNWRNVAPNWMARRLRGDDMAFIDYRYRSRYHTQEWQRIPTQRLDGMYLMAQINFSGGPRVDDPEVEAMELALELRYLTERGWRHELHKWSLMRREFQNPPRTHIDIDGEEIYPPSIWYVPMTAGPGDGF